MALTDHIKKIYGRPYYVIRLKDIDELILNIEDWASGAGFESDSKAKVTTNDTTAGFLATKLVAGANITLNTLTPGGNETLEIVASGGGGNGIYGGSGTVPTSVVATLTDNFTIASPDAYATYGGFVFTPSKVYAVAGDDFAYIDYGTRGWLWAYRANECFGFGSHTGNTTNQFLFNTGTANNGALIDATFYINGDSSHTNTLLIKGGGATSATTPLLVENSSGANALVVTDDLKTAIGETNNSSAIVNASLTVGASSNGAIRFSSNVGNYGIALGGTSGTISWGGGTLSLGVATIGLGILANGTSEGISNITALASTHRSMHYVVGISSTANGDGHAFFVRNSSNVAQRVFTINNKPTAGDIVPCSFENITGLVVGANVSSLNASAILQGDSTTQGFLPPRNADPDGNISTPASGLMAYDSTDDELQFYDGTSWVAAGGGGASIYSADGATTANRTVTLGNGTLYDLTFTGTTTFNTDAVVVKITDPTSAGNRTNFVDTGAQLVLESSVGAGNLATLQVCAIGSNNGGGDSEQTRLISNSTLKFLAENTTGTDYQWLQTSGASGWMSLEFDQAGNLNTDLQLGAGGGSSNVEIGLASSGGSRNYIEGVQSGRIGFGYSVSGTRTEWARLTADGLAVNTGANALATIHVKGAGATSATNCLLVEAGSSDVHNEVIIVRDDKRIIVNNVGNGIGGAIHFCAATAYGAHVLPMTYLSMDATGGGGSCILSIPYMNYAYNNSFIQTRVMPGLASNSNNGIQIFPLRRDATTFDGFNYRSGIQCPFSTGYTTFGLDFTVGGSQPGASYQSPVWRFYTWDGVTANNVTAAPTTPYNVKRFAIHNSPITTGGNAIIEMVNCHVGIGTSTPHASALLDVASTTQGFLPPRMTNAQMTAIATPAPGLMVYDTDNDQWMGYNDTAWVIIG